ncbi:MAG: SDR family NAD(P)-dependent oxidoreductase [Roseobacter sp.]
MNTSKKVALVTGGARGIGRGIAEDLMRDYHVAVLYNMTVPDWAGPEVLTLQADLSKDDATEAIAAVIARFGRLDAIVNNAGVIASSPLETFDPAAYHDLLAVNALAPHALLAAALPHLNRGAAIVNISSVNATLPPRGACLYGASKAAVDLWTKAAAKELGPKGIRVNAVAPGAIDTDEAPRPQDLRQAFLDLTALDRLGTPQDIAAAVRFLLSDAASFITGEVLVVSGGYRL